MLVIENPLLVILVALIVDALVGDPAWLYRRVPHPVALIGKLTEALERKLNDSSVAPESRFVRGLLLTLGLSALAAGLAGLIEAALMEFEWGWLAEALIASVFLAFRGLYEHVRAVARALQCDLQQARQAVRHIVGRDPDTLDEAGVARAAIESTAENFSDGVVAPVFWFVLLGLPGLCAYKTINTIDSLVGHRSPRYAEFGKAAARIDDAVNWLPARLSGLVFVLAACLVPGAQPYGAWRAMRRDAPRHRSVNAGWQEAAVAGALGFALAGPRQYAGQRVQDAWMGDGRSELSAGDVHATLRLYITAGALLVVALTTAWLYRA